jgi:iron(II)-dependent oxidoreductase
MRKNIIPCKYIKKSGAYLSGMLLFLAVFLWPQPGKGAGKTLKVIRDIEESMVEIPAGEFIMGTDRGNANERPAHAVYLDTYFISRYEIANRQYREFLASTDHPQPFFWNDWRWNGDDYPVIGVSWEDANAFCRWLSKMTGLNWRIPTEAEWEKAASWVEKDKLKRIYPWGDRFDEMRVNALGEEDGYERSAPIDGFKEGVSPYGIYHFAGNVLEWCLDWFENDYYTHSPSKNPKGPKEGIYKSVRGGDWKSEKLRIRNTVRKGDWPQMRYNYNGFRVVRTP